MFVSLVCLALPLCSKENHASPPHCRQGSSDEVALLAAEFGLLDQQLAVLVSAVEAAQPLLIAEEDLILVASEIPDLRGRLGIA